VHHRQRLESVERETSEDDYECDEKYFGGSSCRKFKVAILASVWRYQGNPQRTSVKTFSHPTKI
jgi:hypothetical protein